IKSATRQGERDHIWFTSCFDDFKTATCEEGWVSKRTRQHQFVNLQPCGSGDKIGGREISVDFERE
ncbi:hypothetical protein HDU93_005351, partial [Gonapodya sp. JEL0774]